MTGPGRRPLLHFVLLGSLLFGAKQLTSDGRALGIGAEPVVIAAEEVERLRVEWVTDTRRSPSRRELEAAVRTAADDEILLREALRLGLDRTDTVVRGRLLQNMRFSLGPGGTDSALLTEAYALDMPRRDVVTRRRLIQAMEERLAGPVQVDEAEVRAFIAAHPDRYAPRRRVTVDQVFIPKDPASAALLPAGRLERQSEADLARTFGGEFARAAMAASPGTWAGPVRSAYGTHVIRVHAVDERGVDDPAVLRQAWFALLQQRELEASRAGVAALRRAYPVRVDWPKLALAERS